ncbi:MAG: hypothetical protein C4B58_12970 [Deltaproteobacteria bacterium]|nr:MAG: hypothetical protein C4B58_12970 [Deltaproteobacteria bacterium]
MPEDIRDKPYLIHKDILGLNFIRDPGTYLYRRHYRSGLRSQIMQVLNPKNIEKEKNGIIIDGFRWYPRAEPLKILRIFRTRFNTLEDAEEELKRVRIIQTYLAPDHLAGTREFLVDYSRHRKCEILLCGLQEYVQGQILDPWGLLNRDHLASLRHDMGFDNTEDSVRTSDQWIHSVREKADNFIKKLKQMIAETGHVPDLAGAGNLILTRSGNIKLVDINNVSMVSFDPVILGGYAAENRGADFVQHLVLSPCARTRHWTRLRFSEHQGASTLRLLRCSRVSAAINLDDRGYPVCDKSIEALFLIEQKLLGRSSLRTGPIYDTFLDPERMKEVRALD